MTFEEFIQDVRDRAELQSLDEAERAARATLGVLRQRLGGPEVVELTAQLPPFLVADDGQVGDPTAEDHGGDPFDVEEFYRRVTDRQEGTGLTAEDGRTQARAVVGTLCQHVTGDVIDDLRRRLGPGYDDLF